MMHDRGIPKPTLERLPRYLRALRRHEATGEIFISSSRLGSESGIEEFQVRKDLTHVEVTGLRSKGYPVEDLILALRQVLGLTGQRDAIVVGAGRLGTALSQYPGFTNYGFKIVDLFDSDPYKVGSMIGDLRVMSVDSMPKYLREMGVSTAIITVPAEEAQRVTDQLIEGGIKGIWNFAPVALDVPPDVYVRNEDLAIGLASLSYHVARARG